MTERHGTGERGTGGSEEGARVRAVLFGGLPVAVVMVLASLLAAVPLRDTEVVLHRGLDGEPTRTGAATELLVLFPVFGLMTLGFLLLGAYAGWRPSDGRPPPGPKVLGVVSAGVMGALAGIQTIALGEALGLVERPVEWTLLVIGGALAASGVPLLWPRTAERALVLVNLPLPSSPEARRRVGRTCGWGLLAVGATTVALTLVAPIWAATTALVGGCAVLVPVVLISAARSSRSSAGPLGGPDLGGE